MLPRDSLCGGPWVVSKCLLTSVSSSCVLSSLIFVNVTVKIKITVPGSEKGWTKSPQTSQCLKLSQWEWEESSPCRWVLWAAGHADIRDYEIMTLFLLLCFHYFSSHSEYSLYHTSNMINISGMKMLGCILVEQLLIMAGILRLWWQWMQSGTFQNGSYRPNSALSCVCSRWHFGSRCPHDGLVFGGHLDFYSALGRSVSPFTFS